MKARQTSPTTSHNTHLSQHCSRARKNKKPGNKLGRRGGEGIVGFFSKISSTASTTTTEWEVVIKVSFTYYCTSSLSIPTLTFPCSLMSYPVRSTNLHSYQDTTTTTISIADSISHPIIVPKAPFKPIAFHSEGTTNVHLTTHTQQKRDKDVYSFHPKPAQPPRPNHPAVFTDSSLMKPSPTPTPTSTNRDLVHPCHTH